MSEKSERYKPVQYAIVSFGVLHSHCCSVILHPNSRWYAFKGNDGVWRVIGSKIRINLTDEEFRRYFEQVT